MSRKQAVCDDCKQFNTSNASKISGAHQLNWSLLGTVDAEKKTLTLNSALKPQEGTLEEIIPFKIDKSVVCSTKQKNLQCKKEPLLQLKPDIENAFIKTKTKKELKSMEVMAESEEGPFLYSNDTMVWKTKKSTEDDWLNFWLEVLLLSFLSANNLSPNFYGVISIENKYYMQMEKYQKTLDTCKGPKFDQAIKVTVNLVSDLAEKCKILWWDSKPENIVVNMTGEGVDAKLIDTDAKYMLRMNTKQEEKGDIELMKGANLVFLLFNCWKKLWINRDLLYSAVWIKIEKLQIKKKNGEELDLAEKFNKCFEFIAHLIIYSIENDINSSTCSAWTFQTYFDQVEENEWDVLLDTEKLQQDKAKYSKWIVDRLKGYLREVEDW